MRILHADEDFNILLNEFSSLDSFEKIIQSDDPLLGELIELAKSDNSDGVAKKFNAIIQKYSALKYYFSNLLSNHNIYANLSERIISFINTKLNTDFDCVDINAVKAHHDFEAFVMQEKSLLEIFFQFVSLKVSGQGCRKLNKLKNLLNNFSDSNFVSGLLSVLDKNSWISDLESSSVKSIRDQVVHYNTLELRDLTVDLKKLQKVRGAGAKHLDSNIDYIEYCEYHLVLIQDLMIDTLKALYKVDEN